MKPEDFFGLLIPITYIFLLVTERLWPARTFPTVKGWVWIGALFTTVLMMINVILPLLIPVEWTTGHSLMNGARWPLVVQVIVGFLATSLADFLYHRAEHGIHWLWRWSHQVHHSALRVDVSGAAYTSPVEMTAAVVYSLAVTMFVLGLSPLGAAISGFLMAFGSIFQHWNVRTPQWIGYVLQRPESHCLHHEYGVHARNYSVFPLWDMLGGTFHNPAEFSGRVGFDEAQSKRLPAMLAGRDVTAAG